MKIKAVFWDYDNTLFKTLGAHWAKHETVLDRHGIKLDEIFRQRIYENNGNQNWKWMQKELGLDVPQEKYLAEVDAEFQKHMMNLEMRPGVQPLLNAIHELGLPQAIITNARGDSAKPVLDGRKITPLMKFILFKEDYEGRKPDPTPYLKGLEKMAALLGEKIEPKNCIAIEDDPLGVQSARNAGMLVIHRKLNESDPDSPDADYCCFGEEEFIKIVLGLLKR